MKDVKIVIGANYGDEGKGLLTRYFAKQVNNPIIIFHNGSAQRGHTVDYNPQFRHVYHHFGCGTADGVPTFFADSFWIHPMEFVREYCELAKDGIYPITYCDPYAPVVTPFDMLVDHATEAWIAYERGEREYGSCGLGTWCAIEGRGYKNVFKIKDYHEALTLENIDLLHYMLEQSWNECCAQLIARKVDVDCLPEYKDYFTPNSWKKKNLISHFIDDLCFFISKTQFMTFDQVYNRFNMIFEGAQGLGLDMNVDSDWHTTSNTGLTNPMNFLKNYNDFKAEVCYVTRSYATRHGLGEMENETIKKEINADMFDKTNVHNEFQGSLRYGYPEDKDMISRVNKDFNIAIGDARFNKSIAVTHCNEFPNFNQDALYLSNNPYSVFKK